MAKETKNRILTVKGTGNNNKVVLWERDAAHPNGEVFVSNDGKARRVALTEAVKVRLREGLLEEVADEDAPSKSERQSSKSPGNKPEAPWQGYDDATVDEVLAELQEADEETRAKVLDYERGKGNRGRKTIIETLVNWNS